MEYLQALSHVLKDGDNIRPCPAVIDYNCQQHYLALSKKKETRKRTKVQGTQSISDSIDDHNAAAAVALEKNRKKKKIDVVTHQKHPASGSTSTLTSFFTKAAETVPPSRQSTPKQHNQDSIIKTENWSH